jgi:hypothetical protein
MNISHNIVSKIQSKDLDDDVSVKTNKDNDNWFDIECGEEKISLPKSIISLLKSALDKQTETTY